MGLFKRKIKESDKVGASENMNLPDLPQIPELPSIQKDIDIKLPSLPSLTKENEERLNQDIVKNIIKEPDFEIIDTKIKKPLTREIGDENFSPYNQPVQSNLQNQSLQSNLQNQSLQSNLQKKFLPPSFQQPKKQQDFSLKEQNFSSKKQGPVFVRIDKYKNAVDKLQDVKQKLMEIEKILSDIKELKTKEDFELNEWNKEIQDAKSKIDSVDKMLFSQIGE